MTINETITKLAGYQAQLIEKTAECTVLRGKIAEQKHALKVLKERAKSEKADKKPALKKPSTAGRKSAKKKEKL